MHQHDVTSERITFHHNAVAVVFTPLRMTWTTAGEVVSTLTTIVAKDDWTFASHLTVEDQFEGVIGYLKIIYHAPGPASPSLSHRSLQPMLSAAAQTNGTKTERPESPYPYVIPGTHISIVFAGFGSPLHMYTVVTIFLEAELFVSSQVSLRGPLALVGPLQPWKLSNVVFQVDTGSRLRWHDMMDAMEGLVDFVTKFGAFAFTFEIRYQWYRSLGFGQLRPKT